MEATIQDFIFRPLDDAISELILKPQIVPFASRDAYSSIRNTSALNFQSHKQPIFIAGAPPPEPRLSVPIRAKMTLRKTHSTESVKTFKSSEVPKQIKYHQEYLKVRSSQEALPKPVKLKIV